MGRAAIGTCVAWTSLPSEPHDKERKGSIDARNETTRSVTRWWQQRRHRVMIGSYGEVVYSWEGSTPTQQGGHRAGSKSRGPYMVVPLPTDTWTYCRSG